MKRQIAEVEEIMQRNAERLCPECKGTGRIEPSETLKWLWPIVGEGHPIGRVLCLACYGSGLVQPEVPSEPN